MTRSERRFNRRALREFYAHRHNKGMECPRWCWTCAWRQVTGRMERDRQALIARMKETSRDLPPIRREVTEEVAEQADIWRKLALLRQGQQFCEGPHDSPRCDKCKAVT